MTEGQVDKEEPALFASSASTFGKGCALMLGGAALGFFGCLGAASIGAGNLIYVMLLIGTTIIMWGVVTILHSFAQPAPPSHPPTGPPLAE